MDRIGDRHPDQFIVVFGNERGEQTLISKSVLEDALPRHGELVDVVFVPRQPLHEFEQAIGVFRNG